MLNVRSIILGSTPVRTTSTVLSARRQLFRTPTSAPPSGHNDAFLGGGTSLETQDDRSDLVDITTRAGTMITHVDDLSDDRSGQTGVVLRVTAGPSPTTLDILWNADGQITTALPSKLRLQRTRNSSEVNPASPARSLAQQSVVDSHQHSSSRGYKPLLPSKLPKELRRSCPLDSISTPEIENFQIQMDNFLSQGHPRIRQLITGDLMSPLLSHAAYIDYMHSSCAPDDFNFDHADADQHIQLMRKSSEHALADECERLLDNPPHYDGFRPCNNAVFFAMTASLKADDMYVIRDVAHGDGIRLRNKIWHAMTGDAGKSKKLMAMNMSEQVSDVKYKFVRHGVAKYFTAITKTLAKLKSLGVAKQDWEVFSTIFHHMSEQCDEYRQVVSDLRDQLEKDEASVTLKSIEKAFSRKETVHRLGISNKGTPIKESVPMNQAPAVNAASATSATTLKPKNPQQQATAKSKLWPEMTAESNYGPRGSHKRGQCKYSGHRNADDHCWSGCSKCGGCKEYHKRRRLLDEGKKLCTVHKYGTHLESQCSRHRYRGRNNRHGRYNDRHRRHHSASRHSHSDSRKDNHASRNNGRRDYHAKSVQKGKRSRSHSRSRTRSRSRSRSRRSRRHRSYSPQRSVPAHYTKPRYLRNMESFARGGRNSERDSSYPWSSGANRSQSAHHTHRIPDGSIPAHSATSSQYSSASAMQTQHVRRRNMGHIPHNTDGTSDEFVKLIMRRNAKRIEPNRSCSSRQHLRHVVASAAENRPQSRARTTLMDSGAGLTVVDDEDLYIPGSKRPFHGDVLWGDGSRKRIEYAGKAPAIGKMINTGGAASSNLLGVGCTLDALCTANNRDFVMVFDRNASYLMRDAKFSKVPDGGFVLHHPNHPSSVMETARRGPGQSGVYEVPLYDHQSVDIRAAAISETSDSFPFAEVKAMSSLPFYKTEPNWHRMPSGTPVFNADIDTPSTNVSLLTRDIMRKHNAWGHPGPKVLHQMLLQKGTQRSKRLAKKVFDLFQPCNGCLSGSSHKQPHTRDAEQPSSVAVRPMQHIMSDCMGKQNLAIATTPTCSGATIIYLISCQYSKYVWLWLLQSTSDVTAVTEQWLRVVVRQRKRLQLNNDTEILTWRSDNGPDNPKAFTDMLTDYCIDHQRTGAKASQQNGGAEIRIKNIEVKARTCLAWSHGPRAWWGESSLYSGVTHNHTCSLNHPEKLAPITVMYGRKPDLDKLHPFGCLAFIHLDKKSRKGVLNTSTQHGALMGYATGSDGRIVSYRVYNYDTGRFCYPFNVTFNDDVPAIPYIASLRQLAPAVRLQNRVVRKQFNGTDYLGKITHVRTDTDGERLYGVTYSDNDYEEYNFAEIMKILQPYNPLDDTEDDVIEITPFFGSSKQHLSAIDNDQQQKLTKTQHVTSAKTSLKQNSSTRKSSRVRVVRRPLNVGSKSINAIPSSLNRHRLRYAMAWRLISMVQEVEKFRRSTTPLCPHSKVPLELQCYSGRQRLRKF